MLASASESSTRRPNLTPVYDSANRATSACVLFASADAERRNLRRAGTSRNSCRTVTDVPGGAPSGELSTTRPPDTSMRVPDVSAGGRVTIVTWATAPMLGSASPLNPSVAIAPRSDGSASLLVANRSKASSASPREMPTPLSTTLIRSTPPPRTSTEISVAPASSEFSTNSLTTDAGRSVTSPAAILDETSGGSTWIGMGRSLPLAVFGHRGGHAPESAGLHMLS